MEVRIDLRVAELLASRLCHDVIGPVGAVNHGMELLGEDEAGFDDDALKLATSSARQAADILQFYRVAYGAAGNHAKIETGQLRALCGGLFAKSKVSFSWRDDGLPPNGPAALGKLALNLVVLAAEALPRGGSVTFASYAEGRSLRLEATAAGQDAALREESAIALADGCPVDELTPRNVQGYFTKLVVRRLGGELRASNPAPDTLRLDAVIPMVIPMER